MTARERVGQARVYLAISVIAAAVVWAMAGAFAIGVVLLVFGRVTGMVPPGGLTLLPALGAALAAGVTVYRAWPGRSLERVALWVEEREPSLEFALVTATDPALRPSLDLERAAAFDVRATLMRPVARMLLIAIVAVLLTGGAALALSGAEGTREILSGRASAAALRSAAAPDDPLAGLRVTVTPPAYTGRRASTADDPASVTALRGSRIAISGRGSGVAAFLGDAALDVSGGRGWRLQLAMPARPVALTLRHGERRRVIVLEPRADAAPKVRLTSPPRDTIMQSADGSVRVMATIEDDIGIADGFVEYMLSSGAEETFTARTVVIGARQFREGTRGELSAVIDFGSLRMGPGDLISIRAVARDGNAVSGRGVGISDTRTYRVARRDEYDSVAVEAGAPIVPESTVVSQRMLILRAEALLREQPALSRDSVLTRVRGIAADQIRLRERVHDLIYPAHVHAEGEIEAEGEPEDTEEGSAPVNPNLKTAYEEMWSASRELQIAEAAAALPFMRAAAAALDRARLANRYYLRSRSSRIVVDVPRVRMQGKDKGVSATREPRSADLELQEVARDFARAAAIRDRAAAANELSLVRVRALEALPEFAAALDPVIQALRRGREPGPAMSAARAELDRAESIVRDGATWSRW
ncbi:MAG TPA: hypothetical protein VMY38_03080 [Gemmatimonadaceae bacterium]|nr:hypothetical protein [Gemmatimonadaceae bacterium]